MSLDPTPIMTATCEGGDVDLSGYPNLVFAPWQWGEGIRCHSNGTPIGDIAAATADWDLISRIRELAVRFGVSFGEVMDALRYTATRPRE